MSLCLTIALAVACACAPASTPDSSRDLEAIHALRQGHVEAVNTGDVHCFTADAFVMHQDAPYVRGGDAIRAHTEMIFQGVRVTKLELEPVAVAASEALAYEVGVQELAIDPPMEAFKPRRKHLHVYEKQADGTWKISAAMSSND